MNHRANFTGTVVAAAAMMIAAACGAQAAAFDDSSWARAIPGIEGLRQAAGALPSPASASVRVQGESPDGDELSERIETEFHAGHYWEVRRLSFKLAELEPLNIMAVGDLAFSLAMMTHSDVDRQNGKDNVLFRAEDFQDLGGLQDASLLAIATNDALDGFAKGRAVFQWDQPKQAGNPEFFTEYGLHLALEQGGYFISNKDVARGLALCRDGAEKFAAAAALLRAQPDAGSKALLSRVLLIRGNLFLSMARSEPAASDADKALAARDYHEILSLPDVPADVFVTILGNRTAAAPIMAHGKSSALRHLKEIGL
jgi:hypothetical protein